MSYLLEPDVVADLERGGCPVCRASRRAGQTWLLGLIRDEMTDSTVLTAVDRAGGICSHHLLVGLEVAEQRADSLGLTLFAEFALGVVRRRLTTAIRRSKGRRHGPDASWRSSVLAAGRCPVCAAEERRAAAYLEILAGLEEGGRRDLPEGWQLCLPHLLAALDRLEDGRLRQHLERALVDRFSWFEREVAAEIRTHSHRSRSDAGRVNSQRAAEAVRWLAGRHHGA